MKSASAKLAWLMGLCLAVLGPSSCAKPARKAEPQPVAASLASAAGPSSAISPKPMVPTEGVPTKLVLFVGGPEGPASCTVTFKAGALIYAKGQMGNPNNPTTTITPTAEQWREFAQALDAINVWQWQAEYSDPQIRDGTHWSIEIAYAGRALKSEGHNSYPRADGTPTPRDQRASNVFSDFCIAVEKLLGGQAFR